MEKTLLKALSLIGFLMVLGALFGLRNLNQPLTNGQQIEISVPGDDTLTGFYYPGDSGAGILLLEGFGSDQTALRPIAAQFVSYGYYVLTFDFSGHGRSPGGLDFDNAATNRMAKQVLAAEAKLRQLSGLESDQITFIGHSLGARVALQAATLTDTPPSRLILLGTQINLETNQQAEFFTGTSDADLDWVQALGPDNPQSDLILFSGTYDDILKPDSAYLLAEKLSGTGASDFEREVVLPPYLLHNYEIYAWEYQSIPWAYSHVNYGYFYQVRYWFLGITGLFLALIAGNALTEQPTHSTPTASINRVGWFIGGKMLLWIPALIPGALIASAVFFAPLGTPAFNLYYIGFFGGYGVLLWFLYLKGRMPGVDGKILLKSSSEANPQRTYLGALVFILVLLAVSLIARSGWWYTFPLNHRFIWLLVFTPITALGFMIGFKEVEMLRYSQPNKDWLVWVNALVGLFPFFLYTAFLASLGSLSGVVGSAQGLLILALAIATGSLVEKLSVRPWMAALMQAFLLYWLILPQGVLFR